MDIKNLVTKEELESILKQYEKVGQIERVSTKIDSELKSFVMKTIESQVENLKVMFSNNLKEISTSYDSMNKSQSQAIQKNIMNEVQVLVKGQLEIFSNRLLADCLKQIEKKADDIRIQFDKSISNKTVNLEKVVDGKIFEHTKAVNDKMVSYQGIVENLCSESIFKAIDAHRSVVENIVTTKLSESYESVKDDFANLKNFLMSELTKKVIDKKMIEDRLNTIEGDLIAKTQDIIKFQIEQSRQMMEQSTRAEINESLKALTKSLMIG